MDISILYEDAHIIVCLKPAGVPSQSDKTSDFDMVNRLKNYIYETSDQVGQPFIGVVHRLDRPVEGVMVFAKTKFAAKQLSTQIQRREVTKRYFAVLTEEFPEKLGKEKELLTDYLVKNGKTNLSLVTDKGNPNGKKAELYYTIKTIKDGCSLAEIELLTGRHHQIRVQMKEHLAGIWGDSKYNKESMKEKEWKQIGLVSYHLEFNHPKTNKRVIFDYLPQKEPFSMFDKFTF